jgi:septal ring factor EnvC (AmiA/AmiB activator)
MIIESKQINSSMQVGLASLIVFSITLNFNAANGQTTLDGCERPAHIAALTECKRASLGKSKLAGSHCAGLPTSISSPVIGRLLTGYGDILPTGATFSGTVVESAATTNIVAPAKAVILFAGFLSGLGDLAVLDLGCGRDMFITGNIAINPAPTGQLVEPGATLGQMTNSPPYGPKTPTLFYQVNENGSPINPGPINPGPINPGR